MSEMFTRLFMSGEKIFAAGVLFLSTGAVFPLLQMNNPDFDAVRGATAMQLLWAGIYAVVLWLLFRRRDWQPGRVIRQNAPVFILTGLALVSILWSTAELLTLRRGIALLGTTFFGLYLVTRFSTEELLRVVTYTLGLCSLLSLLCCIFLPHLGIHQDHHALAWRGVYENKNTLGCLMALGVVAWIINALAEPRLRVLAGTGGTLSLFMLIMSESITSLLILIGLLVIILLLYTFRRGYTGAAVVMGTLAAAAAAGLVLQPELLLLLTGREANLSGRTDLWWAVWEATKQRPWLGYGYSAFWLGWQGPSAHLWHTLHWTPLHAHNGYLELWLQLGLVGVAVFAASLGVNLFRSFPMLKTENWPGIFPCLFFVFMAVYNVTESAILVRNAFLWILYVACAGLVSSGSVGGGKQFPGGGNHAGKT